MALQCQPVDSSTSDNVKSEVTETFNTFYEEYAKGDTSFIKYYHEDVRWMHTDGRVQQGRKQFIEGWAKTMQANDFELIDYTDPTVLAGESQATTYNDYEEMFISKETGDTTRVNGTWVCTWEEQEDGSWKVIFHTWHFRD